MKRKTKFVRKTKETDIMIELNVDGRGSHAVDSGIVFLDHMLDLFAKHGLFDITLRARATKDIDFHHTNEDIGISLGKAFAKALSGKEKINRFGFFMAPMDEAIASCVIDISGRPFLRFDVEVDAKEKSPAYSLSYARQFLKAFTDALGANLHVSAKGEDLHHVLEAIFKAFAKAFSCAVSINPRARGCPSTKGSI